MRLTRQLNLVLPIETEEYKTIYVHSSSISRDVFEQFYSELGRVFTQCFDTVQQAHLALSAPQLAYPALKKMAIEAGTWEGAGGVKFGLVNEIKRLTNIMFAGEKGWEQIPFDVAIKREMLTEDEEAEILSSLVFFTCISKVAPKDLRNPFLEMAGALRGWETTSLGSTEYMNGLPILTKKENIGKKATGSSIIA